MQQSSYNNDNDYIISIYMNSMQQRNYNNCNYDDYMSMFNSFRSSLSVCVVVACTFPGRDGVGTLGKQLKFMVHPNIL